MTQTTLLTLGAPFGQWPSVAKSFLDERLLDPAIANWHHEIVGAPLPKADGADVLDALHVIKVDPMMLEQLQSLRPTHSPCWGGSDIRLSWTGLAIAQLLPDAKFLIWVEDPAYPLAHWLSTAGGADPEAALAILQSAVQGMVNLVHKHRSRCLVVHVDEAAANPDALARRMKDWLGIDPGQVTVPASPAHDPLNLLLSEQLVASCPRLLRDCERLYASCVPLVESDLPPAPRTARLALEAIEAHQHLVRAAKEAAASASRIVEERKSAPRDELASEHGNSELLLVQLHQVQEELEHYYLAYRDLEAGQGGRGKPTAAKKMAWVDIGTERDAPPHRELSLVLHDLMVDDRKVDHLHVRLVEHHGRSGLVLLQPRGRPAPLAAWDPTGSEGDLSFVALIPTDDHGRQRLQRLGASDWRIVESVMLSIEHAFGNGSVNALPGRWINVARSLAQQLADLSMRFRFDRVTSIADPQAADAFIVTFGNVSFGSRRMAQLQLRWRPQALEAGPAAVELLRPADGEIPLPATWPVDAAGAWQAAWPLPLAGASQDDLAAGWRGMSRTEREFLFGLLDALPAAATAAAQQGNGATPGRADELVAAAALPLRSAYRHFHGTRLRRVVRAARGRLPA